MACRGTALLYSTCTPYIFQRINIKQSTRNNDDIWGCHGDLIVVRGLTQTSTIHEEREFGCALRYRLIMELSICMCGNEHDSEVWKNRNDDVEDVYSSLEYSFVHLLCLNGFIVELPVQRCRSSRVSCTFDSVFSSFKSFPRSYDPTTVQCWWHNCWDFSTTLSSQM